MRIELNPDYAAVAPSALGEFLGIFHSEHDQAQASLFKLNGILRAYLSVSKELEIEEITDPYLSELEQIAREKGTRLQILHVAD